MDLFIKSGKRFDMGSVEETYNTLPIGTYILELDSNSGTYFLEKTEKLKYPSKLYGNFDIVDRWINTYERREGNLGVLLSGLKGSGKTITAKMLALRANKPVILVKAPFAGIGLKNFLADKRLGDCVIFIDEFEKIYEDYGNVDFLEILDGTASTHHLFIFTVNDENISSKMINRPSRIFYRKRYDGLDEAIVREVGNDLLENKDNIEDLVETMDEVDDLSYDILISVIEEMNRYNMLASEAVKDMCVDNKERIFYLMQKIKINGENYYINLDGCRGRNFLSYTSLNCNLYYRDIEENDCFERLSIFGNYPQDDILELTKLKADRYRIVIKDFNKISKSLYKTNPCDTDGAEFLLVESTERDYIEEGYVYNEVDFNNHVVGGSEKKSGITGRKKQSDEPFAMECCAG